MASFTTKRHRQAATDLFIVDTGTKGPLRTGSAGSFAYIGWGTGTPFTGPGTNAAPVTDLATAASEARVIGTASRQNSATFDLDTCQWTGTITRTGANTTITEAGVFEGSTLATLEAYYDHGSVAINTNDSIAYTLKVTHA